MRPWGRKQRSEPFFEARLARPLASSVGGRMSNVSGKPGGLWFPHLHPRPSSGHLSSAAQALPLSLQTTPPEEKAEVGRGLGCLQSLMLGWRYG